MNARVISPEEIIKSMQKTLKNKEKGINPPLLFVPKKEKRKIGEQEYYEYEVVLNRKNYPGLYEKRAHGAHILAFGAYKRSFELLLDGKTMAEACDLLNDHYHFDVMISCFLNFLLGLKNENGRSTPIYLSQAYDMANEEYDKIKELKTKLPQSELDLPPVIASYLHHILLLFHYFPTTTINYGSAKDPPGGGKISTSLRKLDEISQRILTYESTLEVKEAVRDLFDEKALEHLSNEFKDNAFLLPCLMMQIYRIFYSFKYLKWLKRKSGDFSYFADLALYCLHLDTKKSGSQILQANQIIDDLKKLCKENKKDPNAPCKENKDPIKKFSETITSLYFLKNKYQVLKS